MDKKKTKPLNVQGYCCDYAFLLANKNRSIAETAELYHKTEEELAKSYSRLEKNLCNCDSKLGVCILSNWKPTLK